MRKVWVLLIALLIVGVALLYRFVVQLSLQYRNYVRDHYKEWVDKASDGLYEMEVDEISINIFSRKIIIKGIHLYPNLQRLDALLHEGGAPGAITESHIPKVTLSGILWEDLLFNNEINVDQLVVHHPQIDLKLIVDDTANHFHLNPIVDSLGRIGSIRFLQREIKKLSAQHIEIREPVITYARFPASKNDPYILSNGGNISVKNWRYVPGQLRDTTLLFYAQSGMVFLKSLAYYQPGSNYLFSLDSLLFNPETFSADLRSFRMFNIYNQAAWQKKYTCQKTRYHVYIPRLFLREVQWQQFLYNDRLIADTVEMYQPEINIEVDRRLPPDEVDKRKNFPTTLLQRAALPFYLHELQIFDGNIFYHETALQTERQATVAFTQVNATIKNITNQLKSYPNDSIVSCTATATFMNRGKMTAEILFSNKKDRTDYSLAFDLKDLSQTEINTLSTNLALIEIKSMKLKEGKFSGRGNVDELSLSGYLKYENLAVALKKIDTANQSISARPVLSFLANNLALHDSNPSTGEKLRHVKSYLQNKDGLSMITLIWKTLLQATLNTVMKEADYIELMRNSEHKKMEKLERKTNRHDRKKARQARKKKRQ